MSASPVTRPAHDRRLKRLSAWLEGASLLFAVLLPLNVIYVWVTTDTGTLVANAGLPALTQPADWQLVAGGALAVIPALLFAAALLAARRCFALFRRGVYFTQDNVATLRAFGGRIVLSGAFGMILPTLLALLLSYGNPPGSRIFLLELGSTPVMAMLLGATLWAIAVVMSRAVALAEDHAQFV